MCEIKENRLSPKDTGLELYLWMGINPTSHGKRIKVSNSKHKWLKNDNFTYIIPDYIVKAGKQKKEIKEKDLAKLRFFLEQNTELIDKLYNDDMDFDDFIDSLTKFNENMNTSNTEAINEYYEYHKKPHTQHVATQYDVTISEDDFYLTRYGSSTHGIQLHGEDVYLWMGHYKDDMVVVKVSNETNRKCRDVFTIYLPDLEVRGTVKLPTETMLHIFDFIKYNMDVLIEWGISGYDGSMDHLHELVKIVPKTNLFKPSEYKEDTKINDMNADKP